MKTSGLDTASVQVPQDAQVLEGPTSVNLQASALERGGRFMPSRKCKGPTTAENGKGRDMLLLLRKAKESSQMRMCLPDPHMRLTCSDQWVGAGFCKSQKCNRLLEMKLY
ncbi:unnamed protein product [Sphagnum jensenii]